MSWRRLPFVSVVGVVEGMMLPWFQWILRRVWEGNRHCGWMDASFVDGTGLPIETMGFTCCVTLAGIVANPSSFFHWQRGGTAWDVVHTQHTHTNTVERGANEGNPHDRHVFLPFSFSFRSMDRWIEVSFVFFFLKYRFRFLSTEDGDGKGHPW